MYRQALCEKYPRPAVAGLMAPVSAAQSAKPVTTVTAAATMTFLTYLRSVPDEPVPFHRKNNRYDGRQRL
jgi:hypothetical protein